MTDYTPDEYQKMADAIQNDEQFRLEAAYAYRAIQFIHAHLEVQYAHPVHLINDIIAAVTRARAPFVPFKPVAHRYHWELMPIVMPSIKPEESEK